MSTSQYVDCGRIRISLCRVVVAVGLHISFSLGLGWLCPLGCEEEMAGGTSRRTERGEGPRWGVHLR